MDLKKWADINKNWARKKAKQECQYIQFKNNISEVENFLKGTQTEIKEENYLFVLETRKKIQETLVVYKRQAVLEEDFILKFLEPEVDFLNFYNRSYTKQYRIRAITEEDFKKEYDLIESK